MKPKLIPVVEKLLSVHSNWLNCMITGTVKFYSTDKGYGYINPDDSGEVVFVDAYALGLSGIATLHDGQKVTFKLSNDRLGNKSISDIVLL